MMRSLFSAVSGLKSNQTAMDIIGNNIANVNTIGYKTSRTVFQDIFSQTIASATAPTATTGGSNAKQVGLGVSVSTIGMNMTEGSTQSTSNPLDFAIAGEGFFIVDDGSGTLKYTRAGAFTLDAEGYLVDGNGNYILGVSNISGPTNANGLNIGTDYAATGDPFDDSTTTPAFTDNPNSAIENTDVKNLVPANLTRIQITGNIMVDDGTGTLVPGKYDLDGDHTTTGDIVDLTGLTGYTVDSKGVIQALTASGDTVTVGRLALATFNNTGGLEKVGSSYYVESSNSGEAQYNFAGNHCGELKGGSLEMSNVDLSTELTNMIITQRGFQANSRVITTTDSMLEELINLKR
ncbi:flagellar hook protein FlgE [Sporobacter termitidis DSM 10068]|uniref:Flagellar hook protein FlgE n=1 Tax=Sporobacter termitidis DSM 10068 TaxID=1123282 RepID=A0A1M5W836_9FIRM|nr:flagellar hook-basal body complex protein [Sporobacter termitidis]SHH83682.1 flagellar hook protein FlgE [Sporobacter termitidis DSM 10068]